MTDFTKKITDQHPINPGDEFIVLFGENVSPAEAQKTLKDVFNKHSSGKIICALPGGTTVLVNNVNWDIVLELKASPKVRAIGPNRKHRMI